MLTKTEAEGFWKTLPHLLDINPNMLIGITDREVIIDVVSSKGLDIPMFKPGMKIDAWGDRGSVKAIRTGQIQTETINTIMFGVDMVMRSIPFTDDQGVAVGALVIGIFHHQPIAKAFPSFAPMISDMFSEGGTLYLTDLEKVVKLHNSKKFSYSGLKVTDKIGQEVTVVDAIKKRQITMRELTAADSGLPIFSVSYPVFDENDSQKLVGTFNIVTPKEGAHELRGIAGNLTKNLEEMAAVVEQLAASASEVMTNEQQLNHRINEVSELINDINSILQFIRQIADETKMLGLNAAIEAARAGEAGRGFGVVASEIRKMSDESKDTVSRIRALTSKIENSIRDTVKNSNLNMQTSEEQAAATQEITASIQEITSMAQNLEKIAQEKL
ncbi:MAG: methyl-accepting chemotaxis protein [Methylocystaceae bacterium]